MLKNAHTPENVLEVFLQPGDWYWGDKETRIRTILGSCISICVWHPKLLEGGMCHYMLPSRGQRAVNQPLSGKYGDEAFELFLKEMKKNNTKPSEYQTKIFGGAILMQTKDDANSIGMKNVEMARTLQNKYNLNVISEHLGGNVSRRLFFEIWTGDVWMKKMDIGDE
ncbi:MAG TPA: chemotaxis protein CheD [Leptospiraceae bacterium]|nr:chemotaxis protein CheD [Leptospiraceae bacterium]HMY65913.1 chemotaxis protein CheD [Leptospiraceae bacterium]HMZ60843.1 chemotaxis protein CheD [Leptospiraceae bacterium]HNF13678.1 chemotaxis protein CheD [Leptospiraceae bacterium]HNF25070.1 chemotaxis protein CheD [Leptospiraceae bacterium]